MPRFYCGQWFKYKSQLTDTEWQNCILIKYDEKSNTLYLRDMVLDQSYSCKGYELGRRLLIDNSRKIDLDTVLKTNFGVQIPDFKPDTTNEENKRIKEQSYRIGQEFYCIESSSGRRVKVKLYRIENGIFYFKDNYNRLNFYGTEEAVRNRLSVCHGDINNSENYNIKPIHRSYGRWAGNMDKRPLQKEDDWSKYDHKIKDYGK